jgi:hemerythrin
MATTTATPFVIWNDSWLVGVKEVDAQHKHLVSLLNQLHEGMSQGHSKDVLGGILDSLVRYTQAHFTAEEKLMEQSKYPDIVAHKREHVELTEKVLEFQKNFTAGRIALGVEVMQFLGSWLQGHIRGSDKKYVPFLHANGVR